jgi:alpha-glucosidase
MSSALDLRHFRGLGAVRRVLPSARGLLLEVGDELFRADVVQSDVLCLKISQAGRFDETPTYAACFDAASTAPFETCESEESVELRTSALRLVVSKRDFTFDVYRSDGSVVLESARDERGNALGFTQLNDSFLLRRKLAPSDSFYGLGERTGAFDRRGRRFTLWNVDVLHDDILRQNRLYEKDVTLSGKSTEFDPYYATIPFFYHARDGHELEMAGFFIDNGYKGNVEFGRDELSVLFAGGQYTEYVFAGPSMRDVLAAYTFITGRMPLPPLWSLGHHQCRWHDYSDSELVALGKRYRDRDIPCDALWLDIGYMDGYRVFTWHPERFPDPARLLATLNELGFRAVTIVDPGIKYEPSYPVFDAAREQNLLCKTPGGAIYVGQVWPGRTAFPDFVKPETQSFWGELNGRLRELGVAGIWNDMNEPATGDVEPFAMSFDRDGANHPHERYHNQYALLMALSTFQGLKNARPEERPFILSRAGFAGIQRVAAQWLGDNYSEWEHLEMGVAMALGMGVSGQAFIGADIPGFAGNASNELAARWFEYGALTPFCRCHNCQGFEDHYPWSFGSGVERVAREALRLRYRLLPYLYATFLEASESGAPVQRPLVFEFQSDLESRRVEDQFLLGKALLVAPVTKAGETARHVYLPPGEWIDFHSGVRYAGERYLSVPAPLGQIPLFGRAGFVIPMLEQAPASTHGFHPERVELHVFVPERDGTSSSALYEDDGISTAHQRGAYLRTELALTRAGKRLLLTGTPSGSGFPEFRRRELALILHAEVANTRALDGQALEPNELVFANSGDPFELALELA